MPEKQPTFRERIHLLEIAFSEAASMAELFLNDELGPRLQEVADTIDAEVERTKPANKRFEALRQLPRFRPTRFNANLAESL